MAIPGYLQVALTRDYTLGEWIGGGGMGAVYLAKVHSHTMMEHCQATVAVAKVFNCMRCSLVFFLYVIL